MRFLIFVLFGLCITAASSRPSQTDDDDGQVRETEYEAGDGAEEYIQEEHESLKRDIKRSNDDAEESDDYSDDYSEPDSEDPAVEENIQFPGDQKIGSRDVEKGDHNVETIKDNTHDKKSNLYKRTSDTKGNEPTQDVALKDNLYKSYRDQNRNEFDGKEILINNREPLTQIYAETMCNEKLENLDDRNHAGTDPHSSAENVRPNKRDTIGSIDTSNSDVKKNSKDLSKKDLKDLLSSLSAEKVNILKTLIDDSENVAKRDIAKKSNAVDGDKSTDYSRINVRENQEQCHSSIPSSPESEGPHNVHSINTCPPSGTEIKTPKSSDSCNLTSHAAQSDTDSNQDNTQSQFMDDTLTDIMYMNNDNNKQSDVSDLENIANLESYYDFSKHSNNYKENENGYSNDYSEFQKFDSKLLKRDASIKNADASMEQLENSFPKGYENSNSNSDLESLVRVKRTEGQQHSLKDSKQTSQNSQRENLENVDFATEEMSIGSDTDNILSNNEKVDSTLITRGKRAPERIVSGLHNTYESNLEPDRIVEEKEKLDTMNKECDSWESEDDVEKNTELKDAN